MIFRRSFIAGSESEVIVSAESDAYASGAHAYATGYVSGARSEGYALGSGVIEGGQHHVSGGYVSGGYVSGVRSEDYVLSPSRVMSPWGQDYLSGGYVSDARSQ